MSRNTLLFIMVLWLILVLSQHIGGHAWAFNRQAIAQGHYSGLLTGHIVHLNNIHLLLNMLGIGLVLALFDGILSARWWLVLLPVSAVLISIMIYYGLPQVNRYVGLSAVIHTAYVVGTVQLFSHAKERRLALVLAVLITLKLLTESEGQGISLTADLIGGQVLFQAHVYGALVGLFLGAVAVIAKQINSKLS